MSDRAAANGVVRFVGFVLGSLLLGAAALAQAPPQGPTMRGDGPPPAAKPFNITRSDPALDAVVAPNAKAEADRARLRPQRRAGLGARRASRGYLLVGGLLDNVIYKIAADKKVSVFMEKAGYTGHRRRPRRRADAQRPLARAADRSELREPGLAGPADLVRGQRPHRDAAREGRHAHGAVGRRPDGKRFSGPNDIVVRRDDAVYLTDNDFGLRDGGQQSRQADAERHLADQGRQVDDRARRGDARRHSERHRAVARREASCIATALPEDDALRGEAGRLARRGQRCSRKAPASATA